MAVLNRSPSNATVLRSSSSSLLLGVARSSCSLCTRLYTLPVLLSFTLSAGNRNTLPGERAPDRRGDNASSRDAERARWRLPGYGGMIMMMDWTRRWKTLFRSNNLVGRRLRSGGETAGKNWRCLAVRRLLSSITSHPWKPLISRTTWFFLSFSNRPRRLVI